MNALLSSESRCPLHTERAATGHCKRCGRFTCAPCTNRFGTCWQCVGHNLDPIKRPNGWVRIITVALCIDVAFGGVWTATYVLLPRPDTPAEYLVAALGVLAHAFNLLLLLAVPAMFLRWLLKRLAHAIAGRDVLGPMLRPWQVAFALCFGLVWGPMVLQVEGRTPLFLVLFAFRVFIAVCLVIAARRIQAALDTAESALAAS